MKLRERIELEAKSTIGYSEAKNKKSFMVGVSVAFSKAEEHYEREIETLKKQVQGYKSIYEIATNDLKTLASIVNRYSEND
jgi:prefoldin subunit 5